MSSSLKNFADLKQYSEQLKQQDETRKRITAEREKAEQAAKKEANIFRSSVGDIVKIKAVERVVHAPAAIPAMAKKSSQQKKRDDSTVLEESMSDEFDADYLLEEEDNFSYTKPGLGAQVQNKLRKSRVESVLDLHGMRRDVAREALADFLRHCQRNHANCVRIIHGKGLGSFPNEPVIKHKLRSWLIQRPEVMGFCQSFDADGNSGSLLVLLENGLV